MSNYTKALALRPIVMMLVPVAIVLGLVVNSFIALAAWLLLNGAWAWYTRCQRCGTSIYFDKAHPYRTLLAKPHKVCTNCGHRQD